MSKNLFFLLNISIALGNVKILSYEKELHTKLLEEYSKSIRPVPNDDIPVEVYLDFVLEEVNSLDVKEQSLDVNAYSTIKWYDMQLSWNISRFRGIDDIVMDPEKVWTPDISLYNSAELLRRPTNMYTTSIKVENTGNMTWFSPTNWKASCSVDVTWFPFDIQTCLLKFGSWSYDRRRLVLKRGPRMTSTDDMKASYHGVSSGEWKITKLVSYDSNSTFRCCKSNFSTVIIEIILERMALYYLLYTLLPLIALIFSFLLIFHLDIGQRSSYGVTILLSITVYLLVISEQLPKKSDNWPFIGLTFVIEFFLLCLALPFAEYSVHVAERTGRPPPIWLVTLKRYYDTLRIKYPTEKVASVPVNGQEHVELDGGETCADSSNTDSDADGNNGKQKCRELGRFLDVILTIALFVIIILIPLFVAASIK